ncbi:MAG: amidohydrolase [Woeseia sp.]
MNNNLFYTSLCALIVAACTPPDRQEPEPRAADLVFQGGRIYTLDARRSWAQAVAIRGKEIAFVGADEGAIEYIGPDTRVVDLGGRMMLPAFQDIHIHPVTSGMDALAVDLVDYEAVEEYVAAIRSYADENPDESWILGSGWSMAAFGPGAVTDRKLIDAVVSDRPVYVRSADGHTGWANSKALELAGITSDTPDPPNGIIDRDPDTGEPVGSLQEGAMELLTAHIPPASPEALTAGMRYSIDLLNSYGITSIQSAFVHEPHLNAYRALDDRKELTLRVVTALIWDDNRGEEQIEDLERLRTEYTKGRVRATSVKFWQDGVMENYTAALLEPYIGKGDARGIAMVEPEALKGAVAKLDALGFQVHFHAIGDAAIRQCLDAVEEARNQNGDLGNRHHISHLQLIHPDDIPRFRELGVIANFQPLWALADDYQVELTMPYLGPERSRWQYPIRSVQNAGGMIAFGSDWSVSTANPFPQIETAVTRLGAFGETDQPFYPEERIDLPSAIAAFTINAAYVNNIDDVTGSVEVGKLADLIVLDQNLFEVEQADISDTRVLLTLMEGMPVYGDPSQL